MVPLPPSAPQFVISAGTLNFTSTQFVSWLLGVHTGKLIVSTVKSIKNASMYFEFRLDNISNEYDIVQLFSVMPQTDNIASTGNLIRVSNAETKITFDNETFALYINYFDSKGAFIKYDIWHLQLTIYIDITRI